MRLKSLLSLVFILLYCQAYSQSDKTKILLLGSDHLFQVYQEGNPETNVLTHENQVEIQAFTSLIEQYYPDMIMIESLPEAQAEVDSLYALYRQDKLDVSSLEYGRSEVYQLAFRIGKSQGLDEIVCVNSKGGTSQNILDNGDNIELYQNETTEFRKVVGAKYAALREGTLPFNEYLTFLNQPEAYNMIYHLRYLTPARVTNGTFTNPDEMVDTAFIDPHYIGAELISVFKNRDYKIYSNIVTNQLRKKPERMLLIIGVGHIGSLKSIFRDDPAYELVDANEYLMKN